VRPTSTAAEKGGRGQYCLNAAGAPPRYPDFTYGSVIELYEFYDNLPSAEFYTKVDVYA
jgi:hypothetical protein